MYVQNTSTLQSYNQNILRKGIYYKKPYMNMCMYLCHSLHFIPIVVNICHMAHMNESLLTYFFHSLSSLCSKSMIIKTENH